MKDTGERLKTTYIDTPTGIFTQRGTWFRTTEKSLKEYASELLKYESVDTLISGAELWLRFPLNFSVWITPLVLWQFDLGVSSLIIISFYLILGIVGPLYTSHYLSPIVRFLNYLLPQAVLYILFLSYSLQLGNVVIAISGFLFFVLFRWGIISKVLNPFLKWAHRKLYKIPYEDKVLRSLIVKKSLKYHTSLSEVNEIESRIMKKINGF